MILELSGAAVEFTQDGSGPDLLLLHSLLTDLSVFDRVLPPLAAQFRVTRLNLPGYGRSSPLPFETVAAHADHVSAVMDALKLPQATHLFGNGFGAFVGLEFALRHGGRIDRLIVADALAAFPEPARAPFRAMANNVRAGGMAAVLDAAIGRMFPATFAATQPREVERRKAALAQVDPAGFASACLALAGLDLTAELHRIRNRTLVLCGALDLTTPPAHAEALARSIPGATYREIPNAGHCPMVEQPDALVAAIRAGLQGS